MYVLGVRGKKRMLSEFLLNEFSILLKCASITLIILGGYGLLCEAFGTYFNPQTKGTYSPVRLRVCALELGLGLGLLIYT